jgi:hypothetical protein
MRIALPLLFIAVLNTRGQDLVVARNQERTCLIRLTEQAGEFPSHDAVFVCRRSLKGAIDSIVTPIDEIRGRGEWVEVAGHTSDSIGIVLALTDARERKQSQSPRIRHIILRAGEDGRYVRTDINDLMMEYVRDVVQGARMVHKGETARPLTDLKRIDLKSEPYSRILSRQAFAAAGMSRLEPMWLLSDEASGAQSILTYGFDDDGLATVQVVRSWYGPLRRLVYQRGAVVGVTPSGGESPALRVFDESSDSSRYARVIRYAWTDPDADSLADGRYVVQAMTIVSACVIPPKRWDPFPQSARLTRSVRLGFAPGYEGCASARHGDASWPFGSPLEASTSCEILATSKDASDNAWHFIGVRLPNDPAVRRLFGDYSSSETEQLITGGWVAASALDTLGLPGVEVNR